MAPKAPLGLNWHRRRTLPFTATVIGEFVHNANPYRTRCITAIAIASAALGQLISTTVGNRPVQAAEDRDVLLLERAVNSGPSWLQAVAWSPDSKDLAVATALPETQIRDASDLRLLETLPEGPRAFTAFAQSDVTYSSDGNLLGAGYGAATVWSTLAWQPKISLIAPIEADPRRFGVQSVIFSADHRRLIVAYAILAPQATPPIVAFNTDDGSVAWKYSLTPTIGGNPRVTTGLYRLGDSNEIAFGTFESIGGAERDPQRSARVIVLNSDTGSLVHTVDNAHVDRITAMAVSEDGRWIATGTTTGHIEESYNVDKKTTTVLDNRDPVRIWDARSGVLTKQLSVKDQVHALTFSPDGHYLFEVEAKTPGRQVLNVWNLTTSAVAQSLLTPIQDREILALAMSPDGTRLAAVGTGIAVYRYIR